MKYIIYTNTFFSPDLNWKIVSDKLLLNKTSSQVFFFLFLLPAWAAIPIRIAQAIRNSPLHSQLFDSSIN